MLAPVEALSLQQADLRAAEALVGVADQMTQWALAVIGGTAVALLAKRRTPKEAVQRFVYLLFPVGWGALAFSMMEGLLVRLEYTNLVLVHDTARSAQAFAEMKSLLVSQAQGFRWGIGVFFLWLIIYTAGFVFVPDKERGR